MYGTRRWSQLGIAYLVPNQKIIAVDTSRKAEKQKKAIIRVYPPGQRPRATKPLLNLPFTGTQGRPQATQRHTGMSYTITNRDVGVFSGVGVLRVPNY